MSYKKRRFVLLVSLLCAASFSLRAFSAGLSFADPHASASQMQEQLLSLKKGEILEFNAADLERRLGFSEGSLQGLTLTELPKSAQGFLVLNGVDAEPGQYLTREELDALCFVPNETAASANFMILPQGAESSPTQLTISVLNAENRPPQVTGGSYATLKDMRLSGMVTADDPDGDALSIQVSHAPTKGEVIFDGRRFLYTPFAGKKGSDSFTFAAVDRFGNYSGEAAVDIKIENRRSGFRYEDMANHPSEYAVYKLQEKGVYLGEQLGGRWFFHPDQLVTRGDFLIMTLSAAGLNRDLPATVNTRLYNDASLPLWFKPYVRKALDEGVWNLENPFRHKQIPTRAEAVQMVALAAKITDVKDAMLPIGDQEDIPDWALPFYKELSAYRMLDLYDGNAYPNAALDNAYAADLIWQLYKHTHR